MDEMLRTVNKGSKESIITDISDINTFVVSEGLLDTFSEEMSDIIKKLLNLCEGVNGTDIDNIDLSQLMTFRTIIGDVGHLLDSEIVRVTKGIEDGV